MSEERRPPNLRRSLFHAASGIACLALLALGDERLIRWTAGCAAAFVWTVELLRRVSPAVQRAVLRALAGTQRAHEEHGVTSGTWYVSGLALVAFFAPPAARYVGVATVAFGDPLASAIGRRFGRGELPGGRSVAGSTTLLLVGAASSLAVDVCFGAPLVWPRALAVGLAAAVAELASRGPLDDNLTVPVAAAAAALLL